LDTRVILLGTGTPNAEPERHGPAAALVARGQPYLIDAGPGLVRRALQAGLAAERLTHVFITHLHSDHTLGLADLLYTPWTLGRAEPLHLYGPPGLESMVAHLQAAYAADVRERLAGLEPANDTGWQAVVHEIAPGEVYDDARLCVTAITANHGAWPAYAYRCEAADGVAVFSGDTAPAPHLAAAFGGVDVLVHEAYATAALARRDAAWQRYHRTVHTSAVELGQLAAKARPGLLVLTHQLYWGASDADLLAEIRLAYDGAVASGRDLESYPFSRPTAAAPAAGAGATGQ
jgi:ribonuclease BN (tRNA processing enzyme)